MQNPAPSAPRLCFYPARNSEDWKSAVGIREAELLIKEKRIKCLEDIVKEKKCKINKLEENLRFESRRYDRIKKRLSRYEKKEYEDRMRHKREVDRKKREEEMKEEVKRKVRIEEEEREKLREELRNKKLKRRKTERKKAYTNYSESDY